MNKKAGSLTAALEGTQARTQQHEKGITAVDAKADAAGRSATDARTWIYEVTLGEGQDRFTSKTTDRPDDVQLRLDQMVGGWTTDVQMHADILSWSRTRGLCAGVALQGATLLATAGRSGPI